MLKLPFNRPKDRLDVDQMCFTLGAAFDYECVLAQLRAHVGEDERIRELERARGAYPGG